MTDIASLEQKLAGEIAAASDEARAVIAELLLPN